MGERTARRLDTFLPLDLGANVHQVAGAYGAVSVVLGCMRDRFGDSSGLLSFLPGQVFIIESRDLAWGRAIGDSGTETFSR